MNEREIELLKKIKDLLRCLKNEYISYNDFCEEMYDLSEEYSDILE